MSDHEKPKDVLSLLGGFHKALGSAVSGKHGGPKLTAFARVMVLLLGLGLAGPILWHVLWTMPTVLAVFIASGVMLRLGRWCYRRGYFRR